eukprot:UN19206
MNTLFLHCPVYVIFKKCDVMKAVIFVGVLFLLSPIIYYQKIIGFLYQ